MRINMLDYIFMRPVLSALHPHASLHLSGRAELIIVDGTLSSSVYARLLFHLFV